MAWHFRVATHVAEIPTERCQLGWQRGEGRTLRNTDFWEPAGGRKYCKGNRGGEQLLERSKLVS